jgi:CRISPR-associated protein Cmr6
MEKNLSQLFYIKNNPNIGKNEEYGFVRKQDDFKIIGPTIQTKPYTEFFEYSGAKKVKLTTTYPGLLIGAGYSHPALHSVNKADKDDISDFQLGFFFDHTTGLPVIPGSSVKGTLKSVFPKGNDEFADKKLEYIAKLVAEKNNKIEIKLLKEYWEDIFFNREGKNERKLIFLDAYITEIPSDEKIFEDDYITPHPESIFMEPNPIRFMKIAPDVKIIFQFILHPYNKNGIEITAEIIQYVFEKILLDFGIGAKRNVGYGHFIKQ